MRPQLSFLPLLLSACTEATDDSAGILPRIEGLVQVVPSDGIPAEIDVQPANNNLDVLDVDGTIYLAWRTAPTHFAGNKTALHVVSSTDEVDWSFETSIELGTDLREPRMVYLKDPQRLFLYFAVLGDSPTAFEPQGTMYVVREHDGSWSEPVWLRQDDFIPWRIRKEGGQPQLMGYTGGGEIYSPKEGLPQLEIEWTTTQDGVEWTPCTPGARPRPTSPTSPEATSW